MILWQLFKKNWVAIALALIVVAIVTTIMHLNAKVNSTNYLLETTTKELQVQTKTVNELAGKYNELVATVAATQDRINQYYASQSAGEVVYQQAIESITALKGQESLAAKDTSTYTIKLQKVYNDSENEFACLTGNLQFCSPQH